MTAAALASSSSAASSSVGIGRLLAKSAASSSFASGVTGDLHATKGSHLHELELATASQFEKREQRRQYLPRLRVVLYQIRPLRHRAHREQGANGRHCAVDIECARNDVVQRGPRRNAKH